MDTKFNELIQLLESFEPRIEITKGKIPQPSNLKLWDFINELDVSGVKYKVFANFKWSRANVGEENRPPDSYREVYATIPVAVIELIATYTGSDGKVHTDDRPDVIEELKEIVMSLVEDNYDYQRDVQYSRWY